MSNQAFGAVASHHVRASQAPTPEVAGDTLRQHAQKSETPVAAGVSKTLGEEFAKRGAIVRRFLRQVEPIFRAALEAAGAASITVLLIVWGAA